MATKTIETKLKLKVMYDESAINPLENKEEFAGIMGRFICWSKKYSLGHKHNFEDKVDLFKELAYKYHSDEVKKLDEALNSNKITFGSYVCRLEQIIYTSEDVYILPLFLYDHGGLTVSAVRFPSKWDSSLVGYVYTTKDALDSIGCVYNSREDVEDILKSDIQLYDEYVKGEVYGFSIVEYDEKYGNEYGEIESSWGFYGSDMKENGMIDSIYSLTPEEIDNLLIHGTDAESYLVY